LSFRKLVITMPPQVPPSIANAFIALIPGIVLLVIAWFIRVLGNIDFAGGVVMVISKIIPAASSYPAAIFAECLHAFLWTLGIHGDLTIGIVMQPIWTANETANALAVAAGQVPTNIYSSLFRAAYVVRVALVRLMLAFT
jgi:PTS system cellobiose-specific IIC component